MANVFFTSDHHWGHKNICNFRTQFSTEAEHRALVKENYQRVVTKRDKVFFIGDMCFTEEALEEFSELVGNKVLIMGNHDSTENKTRPSIVQLSKVFTGGIHSLYKYKDTWLSHAPIHPDELRGKKNMHGHTHFSIIHDPRYLNVCLEQTDYSPIDLNEVRDRFKFQFETEEFWTKPYQKVIVGGLSEKVYTRRD